MTDLLTYPFDPFELLRKKKSLRRELLQNPSLIEKRIAILGGSTTTDVKDILELFLLQDGIQPVFYESEYDRYFEDAMFGGPEFDGFKPEIVYIHTTSKNITAFPEMNATADDARGLLDAQYEKFRGMWEKVAEKFGCLIIQNNFELPRNRALGNLDGVDVRGKTSFINRLNQMFATYAAGNKNFLIQDINYLASWIGLESWYDNRHWYSYKYAMGLKAVPVVAHNLASILKALWGKSRKALVLDLDNTLWGGVIGDDGLANIKIGKEVAEAEAFHDFQTYVKELKDRGIILAVCSKNEKDTAKMGFEHADSVLRFEDFTAFEANWDPKHENIKNIAHAINIGEDALVFIDDNPAERAVVRAQVPAVSVPEVGDDVSNFIAIIDKSGYFETVSLSTEDLQRNQYYVDDTKRQQQQAQFKNYREFLNSLQMVAEIGAFNVTNRERITQLINKTNQFNLTTRRYTNVDVEAVMKNPDYVTLYGRLADKFGDNGLISCIIGHKRGPALHIDLWLMSCRVLKREMEQTMLDQLVIESRKRGVEEIIGYYFKTSKNGMVAEHYREMGFERVSSQENGDSVWKLAISKTTVAVSRPIRVAQPEKG